MRNPDNTKNTSTPTKPPWNEPRRRWNSTTATTATARRPSTSGRNSSSATRVQLVAHGTSPGDVWWHPIVQMDAPERRVLHGRPRRTGRTQLSPRGRAGLNRPPRHPPRLVPPVTPPGTTRAQTGEDPCQAAFWEESCQALKRIVPGSRLKRVTTPYPGSLGQFGWNRCHCSGERRMRCSSSSARYWVMRATSSRSEPRRSAGRGGRTMPRCPSVLRVKYTATGRIGAPVRKREGCRAGGQCGALAEELDLDATAADVAVTEQADDLVPLQGLQRRPSGIWTEGYHGHPQLGAQLGEPVEQLRGIDPLDDHGDRVALVGEPPSGPLPSPEVGQRENRPRALIPCSRDVLVADEIDPGGNCASRERRQAEALDPVAGVGLEGVLDRSAQPPSRPRRVDASQVALDHRSALRVDDVGTEADRVGQPTGDDPRHHPGNQRPGAIATHGDSTGKAFAGVASFGTGVSHDVAERECAGAGSERRVASGDGCGASRFVPPSPVRPRPGATP